LSTNRVDGSFLGSDQMVKVMVKAERSRANSRSLKNAHTELSLVPNSFASLLVTAIEQQAKYVELLEA